MRRLALLTCLLLSLGTASAHAAETVGTTAGATAVGYSGNFTYVGAGPGSRMPKDGIVTSVVLRTFSASASRPVVKVLRPTDGTTSTVVASIPVDVAAGAADRLVERTGIGVAVRAGDRLGVSTAGGTVSATDANPDGGLLIRDGDAPDGSSWTPTATNTTNRMHVAATLEPDADGDGAADETRDGCPGSPSTAPPCEVDLVAGLGTAQPSVLLGGTTTLVATARAAAGAATGTTATFSLPAGLVLVAAGGDAGRCTGDTIVTCPIGTVLGGATGGAFAVVRATAPGPQAVTASVAATAGDVAPADNSAGATVTVGTVSDPLLPPPAQAVKLCTVPKLTGLTKARAAAKLKTAGCAAGRFSGKGRVRRQSVPRGTRVAAATRVRVTLKAPTRRRAGARPRR